MAHIPTMDLERVAARVDELRPLYPDDADFHAAKHAMAQAVDNPISRGHRDSFWYVDPSGTEAADMVRIVDLAAIGLIARGLPDWEERAAEIRTYPLHDDDSVRDVLESLVWALRRRREASGPRP